MILSVGMQTASPSERCLQLAHELGFADDAISVVDARGDSFQIPPEESQTLQELALHLNEREVATEYPIAAVLLRVVVNDDGSIEGNHQLLASTAQQLEMAERAGTRSSAVDRLQALLKASCVQRELVAMRPSEWQRRWRKPAQLQPGDIIFFPPRLRHIAVMGAVKQPGLYAFMPEDDARSYVVHAQHQLFRARLGEAKAYLPNGRLIPLGVASWNYERAELPPGAVIVVPPWKPQ
ncbi:MAG: hypothetical protein ACX94A_12195 [Algiphilus sp.]